MDAKSTLEDAILGAAADNPKAKYIGMADDSVNELNVFGAEVIHHLARRLHGNSVTLVFSGLKKQELEAMQRTDLDAICKGLVGVGYDATQCPRNSAKRKDRFIG
jgi:MFS superfamily sulfate permease-like transporter